MCQAYGYFFEATFRAKTGHCLCQAWGHLMEVTVQVVGAGYCLYSAWGCLPRGTGPAEASHCLFGVCTPFRDFKKVCLCGAAARRGSGLVIELSGVGVSGNHQGRENHVSQVNGDLRFGAHRLLPAGWEEGSKRNNSTCQHFRPGENYPDSCPSNACPEAHQFSSSPYVSCTSPAAAPVLEPRVNEFVSESVSGHLKRSVSSSPPSHLHSLLVSIARCYGDSSSWHWAGEGAPCFSGETSAAEISLLTLNCHIVGMRPSCSVSLPLLAVLTWLLYSLVIGLLFSCFPGDSHDSYSVI